MILHHSIRLLNTRRWALDRLLLVKLDLRFRLASIHKLVSSERAFPASLQRKSILLQILDLVRSMLVASPVSVEHLQQAEFLQVCRTPVGLIQATCLARQLVLLVVWIRLACWVRIPPFPRQASIRLSMSTAQR